MRSIIDRERVACPGETDAIHRQVDYQAIDAIVYKIHRRPTRRLAMGAPAFCAWIPRSMPSERRTARWAPECGCGAFGDDIIVITMTPVQLEPGFEQHGAMDGRKSSCIESSLPSQRPCSPSPATAGLHAAGSRRDH